MLFFLVMTTLVPNGAVLHSEIGPFLTIEACETAGRSPMVTSRPGRVVEMSCVARVDL